MRSVKKLQLWFSKKSNLNQT